MDILSKAVNKVGAVANQAAAAAAQRRQIAAEQRILSGLRSQALALRAQIGEEMFKLWQAHKLPPSSLDHLFEAVNHVMAAIEAQRRVVDELIAGLDAGGDGDAVQNQEEEDSEGIEVGLPPPPVPAAPTRHLTAGLGAALAAPPDNAPPCPTCGAAVAAGKRYCGFCGTRLT